MKVDTTRYIPLEIPTTGSSEGGRSQHVKVEVKELDPKELESLAHQVTDHCIENSPRHGSLYTGGLGPYAYLQWKWARRLRLKTGDAENSSDRKVREDFLKNARQSAEHAFLESYSNQFRVSLLEGKWVGAKCLMAVIAHEEGDINNAQDHATELLQRLTVECTAVSTTPIRPDQQGLPAGECDVLYGRAGALQAVFFLRRHLTPVVGGSASSQLLGHDFVVATARHILKQGLLEASRYPHLELPLLWVWHGKVYLGAAHGIVGILHTLLQLSPEEWSELAQAYDLPSNILQLVDETIAILTQRFCWESGNLDSSLPTSPPGEGKQASKRHLTDRLVQWCHGAPGHVLLLLQASKVFSKPEYQTEAIRIAENVIWPRGLLRKGMGLCHGISGNAMVLLQVSQAVAEESQRKRSDEGLAASALLWRQRVLYYARYAMEQWDELEAVPDRPYSLYEGLGGFVCLLWAILDSQSKPACFPLYEH